MGRVVALPVSDVMVLGGIHMRYVPVLLWAGGEITACEDCGHINVRLKNAKEIAEFERAKAELRAERVKRDE
jgi:hypothetical protein